MNTVSFQIQQLYRDAMYFHLLRNGFSTRETKQILKRAGLL